MWSKKPCLYYITLINIILIILSLIYSLHIKCYVLSRFLKFILISDLYFNQQHLKNNNNNNLHCTAHVSLLSFFFLPRKLRNCHNSPVFSQSSLQCHLRRMWLVLFASGFSTCLGASAGTVLSVHRPRKYSGFWLYSAARSRNESEI